jgi:hypothetical protein
MNFKDVAPEFIVAFPGGYEIHQSSEPYHRINPKTGECTETNSVTWEMGRHIPVETRKNARAYIKGLKKLFASAKTKHFFEAAGEQIHGNVNTVKSKYKKLVKCISTQKIIDIGNGSTFTIESYVDGSYTIL